MATPNYEQISSFAQVTGHLKDLAVEEFLSELDESMTYEEIVEEAVRVAEKFKMLGSELGAQWYDLCSELAGVDVDPAVLEQYDENLLLERAEGAKTAAIKTGNAQGVFSDWLRDEIMSSVRETGTQNLWRDYDRGTVGGKWCRVPVGETCAWCIMLASQGAWYVSKESALGREPDHYHRDCNCIAVYHADANSISGYSALQDYKSMYYGADNARRANASGKTPYPDDLQERISKAKAEHSAREAERKALGLKPIPWSVYNEDLIVMRYQNGLT